MAVSLTIIGKENSPLYIWMDEGRDSLQLQYLAHTGLDVIQEKISVGQKLPGDSRELYLGLLYASEEYKIYGYTTNSKIKFIVITDVTNAALRDNEIRMMFRHLHSIYSTVVCNPFYVPGEKISSQ
ncbi:Trafficking protein particle complex subunit 2-like protein [Armadillidium nasatum]|uniref:Trafficking protein particle complex subunit 2-like protein n=1 Tax=Armadillidium nasatum TaxID=96803 RepID=A0A5N5TDK9_9CRUS|nr:Trafficking protein particle complex subunit 2-like protein [Armadillidium nasatum]